MAVPRQCSSKNDNASHSNSSKGIRFNKEESRKIINDSQYSIPTWLLLSNKVGLPVKELSKRSIQNYPLYYLNNVHISDFCEDTKELGEEAYYHDNKHDFECLLSLLVH